MPELQFIDAKDEVKIPKVKEILYNGFFRKSHEQHVHTLYKIDLTKNKKIEIPPRKGPPKLRPGVNPTLIGAWAIASTPIPDFAETDYFLGLYPEGHINRKKRR